MGNFFDLGLSTGFDMAVSMEFCIIAFFVGLGILLKAVKVKVAVIALALGVLTWLFAVSNSFGWFGENFLSGFIFLNLTLGTFIVSLFGFDDDLYKKISAIVASLSFLVLAGILLISMIMSMFP